MRRFALVLVACALAACGPPPTSTPVAAEGCARTATHDVAWTTEGAPDVITTRADGPTCLQAAVTLVARNADGEVLWTFISTYYDMTAGGIASADAPAVTPEQMDTFLASWASVTTKHSSELPAWAVGDATLTAPTFSYSTPFERETYEMLRARNLPMICYAAAAEATQCLVIDPSSHAPTMIVAYGPAPS
jgi:hypothetical protein